MVIEMTAAKRPPTMHENMTEELVEKIKVGYSVQAIFFQNLWTLCQILMRFRTDWETVSIL